MGGFWLCLDEINQLEIGLFSSIIRSIQAIREAIFRQSELVELSEGLVKLKPTCAIFCTLNDDGSLIQNKTFS